MRNLILENVRRMTVLLQVNLSVDTEESYQSIVAIWQGAGVATLSCCSRPRWCDVLARTDGQRGNTQ
jgi:hypothetical protein